MTDAQMLGTNPIRPPKLWMPLPSADILAAALHASMSQTKEILSAALLPPAEYPPKWLTTPYPGGGFYERKRLRNVKSWYEREARNALKAAAK